MNDDTWCIKKKNVASSLMDLKEELLEERIPQSLFLYGFLHFLGRRDGGELSAHLLFENIYWYGRIPPKGWA